MDKRQFAEEVINSVRNLSVVSVLSTRMDLRRRGMHTKGLCPFHADRTIGSFVATDAKGIWKCFSCSAGGDAIKFVSLFDDINYLESAFKIALEFGIITSSEYEEYFERRRYTKEQISRIERKYQEIDRRRFEMTIADEDTLNVVFRIFISHTSLSDEHKKILMEERNLTEDEIWDGLFFTFPQRSVLNKFLQDIRSRFGDERVLAKIPGFYFDKKEKRFTFSYHRGIGIGIMNASGKVVGIQIRRDKKDDTHNRYTWFSSSFASFDDKYEFGTSSGSPVDVVYPEELVGRTVFITEGRFKAMQIAKEKKSIAISVQGVGSWRGILKELKNIPNSPAMKRLSPDKEFSIFSVMVAFDSDMNYKVQVFSQAKKMTDSLRHNDECEYPVYYLNWDDSFGKGIDDVFISGHKEAIERFDKQAWDKAYEKMIEAVLDENGDKYLKINDVPTEVVREYFKTHMKIPPLGKGELSPDHIRLLEERQKKAV